MTSKTTIGLAAIGLALVALAPVASGLHGQDDTLSRVFPYYSITRAEIANDGIGWYDNSDPPNVCLDLVLRGLQIPVSVGFYYEQARVWPNLPGYGPPQTFGVSAVLPPPPATLPCPPVDNPQCNAISGCAIHLEPIAVGPSLRTMAPQAGIICEQVSDFVTCFATDSYWHVGRCDWDEASFTFRDPTDVKQANKGLLAGTPLQGLALSRDIDCDTDADGNGILWDNTYDVSYLLGTQGDLLEAAFEAATVSLVVPFGNGVDDTGFFVSCLGAVYSELDTSTPIPTLTEGVFSDGVDWLQVLDLDGAPGGVATNWVGDLVVQLGPGDDGQLLAGLYDLGAKNTCDFVGGTAPTCHDGIDNDLDATDANGEVGNSVDEGDSDCYVALAGPVGYYNADSNNEPGGGGDPPWTPPAPYSFGPVVIQKSPGDATPRLAQSQPGCAIASVTADSMSVSCTPPVTGNWQCHNPGLVADADVGSVTGNTWCTNGPTASATSTGNPQWSGVQVGLWNFPWYCEAIFASGSTGNVLCDAPDPPLVWPL